MPAAWPRSSVSTLFCCIPWREAVGLWHGTGPPVLSSPTPHRCSVDSSLAEICRADQAGSWLRRARNCISRVMPPIPARNAPSASRWICATPVRINPSPCWDSSLDCDALVQAFRAQHQQRFGYSVDTDQQLAVEMIHVDVAAPQQRRDEASKTEWGATACSSASATVPLHQVDRG